MSVMSDLLGVGVREPRCVSAVMVFWIRSLFSPCWKPDGIEEDGMPFMVLYFSQSKQGRVA